MSGETHNIGKIGVELTADPQKLKSGLKQASDAVKQTEATFKTMGVSVNTATESVKGFSEATKNASNKIKEMDKDMFLGAIAYSTVALGVRKMASQMTDAFAKYEKAVSNAQLVFNGSADSIIKDMSDMASKARYTRTELIEMVGQFQVMLTGLGQSQNVAKDYAKEFSKVAVDLSTFWGRPLTEGVRALQTAIYGRTESLRRMGVGISNAIIKERALSMGYADQAGNATLLGKSLAILRLAQERMSVAMNYARETSGLLINRLRGLRTAWTEFMVEFGKHLSTFVTPMIEGLTRLLEVVTSLIQKTPLLGKALSVALLGIGTLGAVKAGGAFTRLLRVSERSMPVHSSVMFYTARQASNKGGMSSLSAGIAGINILNMLKNSGEMLRKIGSSIVSFINKPAILFSAIIGKLAKVITPITTALKSVFAGGILKTLSGWLSKLVSAFGPFALAVSTAYIGIKSFLRSLEDENVKKMFSEIKYAMSPFVKLLKDILPSLNIISTLIKSLGNFLFYVVEGFNLLGNAIGAFVSTISKGYTFKDALDDMRYDVKVRAEKLYNPQETSVKKAVRSVDMLSTSVSVVEDKMLKHAEAIEKITEKYRPGIATGKEIAKDISLAFESGDMNTVSRLRDSISENLAGMSLDDYLDTIEQLRKSIGEEIEIINNKTYRFASVKDRIFNKDVLDKIDEYKDIIQNNLIGAIEIDPTVFESIEKDLYDKKEDVISNYFRNYKAILSGKLDDPVEKRKLEILYGFLKDINTTEITDELVNFIDQVTKAVKDIDIKIVDGKEIFGIMQKEKDLGVIDEAITDAINIKNDIIFMFEDIEKSYNKSISDAARPEIGIFDKMLEEFNKVHETGDSFAVEKFAKDFSELTKDIDYETSKRLDEMINGYYMGLAEGFFDGTADYEKMSDFLKVMEEYETAEDKRKQAIRDMHANLLPGLRAFEEIADMLKEAASLDDSSLYDSIKRNIEDTVKGMDFKDLKDLFDALSKYYDESGIKEVKDILDESKKIASGSLKQKLFSEIGTFEGFKEDIEAALSFGDTESLTRIGKNFADAIIDMDADAQMRISEMFNEYLKEIDPSMGEEARKLIGSINSRLIEKMQSNISKHMESVSSELNRRMTAISDYEWDRYDRQMNVKSASVKSAGESSSSMALNNALSKIEQPSSMSPEQREMHEMKIAQFESVELQRRLLMLQQQHLDLLLREQQFAF